jgi:polyphosphate kinase
VNDVREPSRSKPKSASRPLPPDRFLSRELTWLEFNRRVLEQAAVPALPLLERAKFLAIASSNLDEFFMVRVGSLKLQYDRNPSGMDPSGMTVAQQLATVAKVTRDLVKRQYELYNQNFLPEIAERGIERVNLDQASSRTLLAAREKFEEEIEMVISPQIVSQHRPFPLLQGLGLYICVRLKATVGAIETPGMTEEDPWDFAVVPLGKILPRVVQLPPDEATMSQTYRYVLLEELITHCIADLFPSREVVECVTFRIVRNADVELREDEAFDLMVGMEDVLETRRLSRVVRLEYSSGASDATLAFLSEKMELIANDLFPIDGPLDLTYLFSLSGLEGFENLKDEPWPSQRHPLIDPNQSMFANVAANNLLLVHPYERFDPVVRLIEEAANDPGVLSIKQALYRTSRNSPIVAALMKAARAGKYVSAIVELKARFDEARNIDWAREMELAGVQVIYGIRGLKTHAKVCIIVRRERTGIVRYIHFGTGNYNEVTAQLYSDISLLTCDEDLGADATSFFNGVTGASQPQPMNLLSAAPLTLRQRILDLIDGETQRSRQGQKGEIVAKMNALADTDVIDALYRASQAGVRIRLNIRGVCCLRPGVKGLSETIEVTSVIDRYLEHARIFSFRHGGDRLMFISSADWMPRNLDRRVELFVPIIDPANRDKLRQVLSSYFKDNASAWRMDASGLYTQVPTVGRAYRCQYRLHRRAVESARTSSVHQQSQFETYESKSPSD